MWHNRGRFPAALVLGLTVALTCVLAVCTSSGATLQTSPEQGGAERAKAGLAAPRPDADQPQERQTAGKLTVNEDYRLGAGDTLIISVYGEQGMSGKFQIGPGGTIALPFIGQLTVEDMRLRDVEEFLTRKIGTIVRNPSVTVAIDPTTSVRKVYVSGEVGRHGSMVLPFGSTVTDGVAAAQPGAYADLAQVRLTRPGEDPIQVDCSGLRKPGPLGTEHILRYGDQIFVPRRETEVAVLGAVNSPTKLRLPVDEDLTVLDAIGGAGGIAQTGDRASVVLLRDGREAIDIDLGALLDEGDMSQNYALESGDVVLVREAAAISVVGSVQSPRVLKSGVKIPIVTALAAAGGPSPSGDLTRVRIIRGGETMSVDLQQFMDEGRRPAELMLLPGDILLVPEGKTQNVLVMGALARVGSVDLRALDKKTLLRVITMAGPTQAGDLRRVTVYREGAAIVRDIQALMDEGDLSQNLELEPGDLVVVPTAEMPSVVLTGAVQRSGTVRLVNEDLKDLGQLVLTSGPLAHADLSHVTVTRGDEEFTVNIQSFVEEGDRSQSMQLQDGDMIRVPYATDSIMLTGALMRGGVLRLTGNVPQDLARLVLTAGPTEGADLARVTVHRGEEHLVRDVEAFLEEGDQSQSLQVQPGDIITVPQRARHNVLITGAVSRPGLVSLVTEQARDLAHVITAAAPLQGADLSAVQVIRGGKMTSRDIDSYYRTGSEIHTLQLEDGDLVVVPSGEQTVLVTGALARTGKLALLDERDRDLLRVIMLAGPAPNADLSQVQVVRGGKTIVRDLREPFEQEKPAESLMLQDGDIVRVPAYSGTALIAGAVASGGVVGLASPAQRDLAKAVTMAGPQPYADLRHVRVHRGGETMERNVWAYSHEGDDQQTLELEDGDVVLVPVGGQTAFITGAVSSSGTITISEVGRKYLAELVTMAGPLQSADLTRVTIYRSEERTSYDLSGLREGDTAVPEVEVLADDRILVPSLEKATVLVYGALARTGAIELVGPQRDLGRAVMSAGPVPGADLSAVMIHRENETITRDLRAYLEEGKDEETLELLDGDRILVPVVDSRGIMITGQVSQPGPIAATVGAKRDLLSAVLGARPNPQTADLTRVAVYRDGERQEKNLASLQEQGDMSQNMILQPGDLIHVPRAQETVIFAGHVENPGPLNVHTVKERDLVHLLPVARPEPTAGLDRVKVYRGEETLVRDYRAIMEKGDMSQNLELRPGDFVYVPPDTTNNVMVLGELARNGIVNVRRKDNRSLLRIVTMMQPQPTADLSRVAVFTEEQEPSYHDLRRLQDEGDLSEDTEVAPGSVIVVPKLDVVYVVGGVSKPGAYPLDPDWGLMDVITRAGLPGGFLQTVTLIRRRPDGTAEAARVNLQKLRQGKLPQPVKVKAGDVLYVPPPVQERKRDLWRVLRDALWTVGAVFNLFD